MVDDDKEKYEKQLDEKKKEKEAIWWRNLPPWVYLVVGFLLFLSIRSLTIESAGRQNYIWLILLIIGILYLMSKSQKVEDAILSPKEARILAEREMELYHRWNVLYSPMSEVKVLPVMKLIHSDAQGIYYLSGAVETNPYKLPIHHEINIMAKGPEKGFVLVNSSIGAVTGRERPQEKTIWGLLRKARSDPVLGKWLTQR